MALTLREATPDDAPVLLEYLGELFSEPERFGPVQPHEFDVTEEQERELLQQWREDPHSLLLTAWWQQQLVGELSLKGFKYREIQHNVVLGMSVHRGWRRQGIGSALLQAAIEWSIAHPDIRRIELCTYADNHKAHRLYEKFGFQREGIRKGFVRRGDLVLDDFLMALYLEK